MNKATAVCLTLAIIAVCAGAGTLIARYVTKLIQQAEMLSGSFYMSSDMLEETPGTQHTVANWYNDGVTFEVYNYDKGNIANLSKNDLVYELTLPTGWIAAVKDGDGNTVLPDGNKYTIYGGSAKRHLITLSPSTEAKDGDVIQVSANAKKPYSTALSAEFLLKGEPQPEYRIDDCGTYVLVVLFSHSYSGAVSVRWDESFSPDTTDPLMGEWTDGIRNKNVTVTSNTTYELIFYKNTSAAYSKDVTSGTTVNIG